MFTGFDVHVLLRIFGFSMSFPPKALCLPGQNDTCIACQVLDHVGDFAEVGQPGSLAEVCFIDVRHFAGYVW